MEKFFEIKIYDCFWNFKKQIKKTSSKIEFSENINGVQGNLNLEVFWSVSDFSITDIVEIRETYFWNWYKDYFWDDLQNWDDSDFWNERDNNIFPIYSWIVENVWFVEYEEIDKINLQIYWVWTALNDIIYKNSWNKVFTKTWTYWEIAKDIIDYFNSQYGTLADTQNLWNNLFFYTSESIDDSWDDISLEFENENCYGAFEKLVKDTEYYFFINPAWLVTFKKNSTPKILTFKKEIVSIANSEKKDEMVNKYYLSRDWGYEQIYTNTDSLDLYKLKEKVESRSEIKNSGTQNIFWNAKIEKFWFWIIQTEIEIKAQRNNFLYPWEFITTQNTRALLENKRIEKIDKRSDVWILYLGDYTSFWKTVISQRQ
jgi:hypothetical protein